MDKIKLFALLAMAAATACVSPAYHTARTTEGYTIGGGLSGHYISTPEEEAITGGIDLNFSYAPNNWFSVVGRSRC